MGYMHMHVRWVPQEAAGLSSSERGAASPMQHLVLWMWQVEIPEFGPLGNGSIVVGMEQL